jgi:prolyl oligopeptidase
MRIPPPPRARVDDVVDVLHGVAVRDPYRWLEDGSSEEVAAWVAAQNARTRAVLDALPHRRVLHERLVTLLQTPVVVAPTVARDRLFTLDRAADADQAMLMVRSSVDASVAGRVVLDPVAVSGGDTTASIDWFHPSRDGRLVAFGMSEAGSERSTLRVLDVDTGGLLDDVIDDTRGASVAWAPDGSGFAYTRYPPGEDFGRHIRWHVLGTPADDDPVVFEALDDPTAWPDVAASDDGRWLVVHVEYGWTRSDVVLIERASGERTVVIEGVEAVTWARVIGPTLWAWTTLDAGRGRIVAAPVASPKAASWSTVVPEGDDVIESLAVTATSLVVGYGAHAASRLRVFGHDGSGGNEVMLPGVGSLAGLDAEPEREDAFVGFTSFVRPPGVWRWSPSSPLALEPWVVPADDVAFDPDAFVVEQVRYPSGDGTFVPLFTVRHRSTVVDRSTPTVLTGYGGFSVSMSPAFGAGLVALCEAGVVWAVACLRGGSEYGEEWHRAGMLANKQQSFDDFAAAANWLCDEGRTSPERLAIRGGSNGGLLVGATITQRPELCRAAVCAVPLLDMLRFDRFLIGALWVSEYGDPSDPEAFRWLHAWSPYHRVEDGVAYPSVLLLTAEADSRVDPMHARKFAARLQAATSSLPDDSRPVLLRVESRAGHGAGKPVTKQADELADTWAFVLWQLGAEVSRRR